MEGTQREVSTTENDSNVPGPWVLEPVPEVEANNGASSLEEAPIEEPGYGHGV